MDTIKLMQARFWEVKDKHDSVVAEAQPLHAEYDALAAQIAELQTAQRVLVTKWREIEAPTVELSKEMTALVKALQGKTGERPA